MIWDHSDVDEQCDKECREAAEMRDKQLRSFENDQLN